MSDRVFSLAGFSLAAAFALGTGCTTTAGATMDPDGGPNMIDSDRSEAGTAADTVAACTTAPQVVVVGTTVTDATHGFQFSVPVGFTSRRTACEDIPSLLQTTPEPNRQPRKIAVRLNQGAYDPRSNLASTSSTGIKYYLIPGIGQETGKVSEWHLIVPSADWMVQFTTDAEGKSVLEEIAAGFRWTR